MRQAAAFRYGRAMKELPAKLAAAGASSHLFQR